MMNGGGKMRKIKIYFSFMLTLAFNLLVLYVTMLFILHIESLALQLASPCVIYKVVFQEFGLGEILKTINEETINNFNIGRTLLNWKSVV